MIFLFWSPLGLPVIQDLPPKVKFGAESFVENILADVIVAK
jgi:hypothetical protein